MYENTLRICAAACRRNVVRLRREKRRHFRKGKERSGNGSALAGKRGDGHDAEEDHVQP